ARIHHPAFKPVYSVAWRQKSGEGCLTETTTSSRLGLARNFCRPHRAIFARQTLAGRMGGPGRQFIREKYAEIFISAIPWELNTDWRVTCCYATESAHRR